MDKRLFVLLAVLLTLGVHAIAAEIHVPADVLLRGQVVIAEWFYTGEGDERVAREFHAWPGDNGWRDADWFDVRISAQPGDTIVLSEGTHKADLWVFTPGLTITTEPNAEVRAEIWGTVEIDADRVTLRRITVTGPRKDSSSGHGIEINREVVDYVTVRNCRSADNAWTGIHVVGPRGSFTEYRVENCELVGNGMDGIDAQSAKQLIITGCTITDNGWNLETGVGVRIGSYVENIVMEDNVISGNRYADVVGME